MQKLFAKTAGVVVAVALLVGVAVPAANALTTSELINLLVSLGIIPANQAGAALSAVGGTGTAGSCATYTRDLTVGSNGQDVVSLQTMLEAEGYLTIPASVSKGYFGSLTQSALASYQAANGITPATGYFGEKTRAHFSANCNVAGNVGGNVTPGTSGLEGGAGSIKDVDYVSKLSNEEVGEDESDVEVAGIEIEADDNSDIEIVAVNLNFSQGTAGSDFDKYADVVTVWLDGEKYAEVDADEFEDDDSFDKTITLDRGAVIDAGEVGDLVVAVSGINNLDSDDATDTWTLEFESVRYRDASGAVITDSDTGDINDGAGRTFSFENFATASDMEVKFSKGDETVNDSQTIRVDSSNDTDGVEVLAFEIEVEGDSEIDIDDASVDFTSVGAGVGEIINTAELWVGDELIGSETVSSTSATTRTITFDNLDWQVEAGDTIEVVVKVDINDIDGGFSGGDTLTTDVNPDDAAWDMEDGNGDNVSADDKTGAATSDAHTFYAEGIVISFEDSSAGKEDKTSEAAGGEVGVYSLTFTVEAFESDIYIPFGATVTTTTVDTDDGIAYAIEDSNGTQILLNAAFGASTSADIDSDANTSGSYYVVEQGAGPKEFTLNVDLTAIVTDGYYGLQLVGVNYNVGSADVADVQQLALPANDFDTSSVNIDYN